MCILYYLINHTTGGDDLDNFTNLRLIICCLANPIYRIEAILCSELYHYHLAWASFANGTSYLHSTSANQYCRRIESAVFIRNSLDFVSVVDEDWTIAFPKTYEFLQNELTE